MAVSDNHVSAIMQITVVLKIGAFASKCPDKVAEQIDALVDGYAGFVVLVVRRIQTLTYFLYILLQSLERRSIILAEFFVHTTRHKTHIFFFRVYIAAVDGFVDSTAPQFQVLNANRSAVRSYVLGYDEYVRLIEIEGFVRSTKNRFWSCTIILTVSFWFGGRESHSFSFVSVSNLLKYGSANFSFRL